MRKILYHGFYGFKNSGDDSFVEVCAWGGAKYWHTTDNIFLSGNLPETVNPAGSIREYKVRALNRIPISVLASEADCLVCAGGTLFTKVSRFSLMNHMLAVKNVCNRKMKIGAIGVSIGPFENVKNENNVKKALKRIDFLALRDKRSYELALSMNLPYEPVRAFDLAALLPEVYSTVKCDSEERISKGKIIGISVCNYERYAHRHKIGKEIRRNKYLLELFSMIPSGSDIILRFFVFNGHPSIGDEKITDEFIHHLKDRFNVEKIPYLGNVYETWKKISECDLVFSTRLHAGIFACYAQVPFFIMEYHQKCTDFLTDVGQAGKYRIYDGETSPGEVVEEMKNILYENRYIPPSNRSQTVCLSENNFLLCNRD